MTSAPVEGRGCTIHQLFNGHRYQLDYYQREYTWRTENVRRLIEDLHRRFNAEWNALHDRRDTSRYKPYFLGPYVYFQDGDITHLVDGQQRVSTLHLILILIHNLLIDQDALGKARQREMLIRSVMYGERRYTIDIPERAPLLNALMDGDRYQVKPGDPRAQGRTLTVCGRFPARGLACRAQYGRPGHAAASYLRRRPSR
ncbi:MAG TPA: DUF262 domain-containing protein [Streptosporangiaceae bacterium]|jgi:hypothetical protein|nr:DUF262 domain-containing protein [Streptosporangiaceae bacterium]